MDQQTQLIKANSDLRNLNIGKFEKQIVVCSQGNKIETATDEKIKELLKYLFVVLGVKDLPNEIEKMILISSIRSTLGRYTLEDIVKAFELAMVKVITFELCLFDKVFNIVYLNNLMSVYEVYRSASMVNYRKQLEESKVSETPLSKEEIEQLNYKSVRAGCIGLFEKYKSAQIPINEIDLSSKGNRYEFLRKLNLIKFEFDEIEKFRERAVKFIDFENELIPRHKKTFSNIINTEQTLEQKIESYIKNICVMEYFKTLIKSNKDLETEIKKAENKIQK